MTSPSPTPLENSIYLVAAHPNWRDSRVNKQLLHNARNIPSVNVNDLYSTYPDYVIDVQAEQDRLASAQMLVLMHPIQWYSMPPLQKLWLDEVLSYGWAYGGGTALRGKDCWLVITTGGSEESYRPESYNNYSFEAFLPPYKQTFALCGMRFLPPLLLHGARDVEHKTLTSHIEAFQQRLSTYPHWPELASLGECASCEVPSAHRPQAMEKA